MLGDVLEHVPQVCLGIQTVQLRGPDQPGLGTGAALGAKLASREQTVICTIGDGAYMCGNPTAAHFAARAMNLPVLFVVFNNARWNAVHRATTAMYPKGQAAALPEPPFATLSPSPDFENVVEASAGLGLRFDHPDQLEPALRRGLQAVMREQRQARVNVRIA